MSNVLAATHGVCLLCELGNIVYSGIIEVFMKTASTVRKTMSYKKFCNVELCSRVTILCGVDDPFLV